MYGKISALPVTSGVALLPFASNRVLFIAAVSLVAVGIAILVTSTVLARKSQKSAN